MQRGVVHLVQAIITATFAAILTEEAIKADAPSRITLAMTTAVIRTIRQRAISTLPAGIAKTLAHL